MVHRFTDTCNRCVEQEESTLGVKGSLSTKSVNDLGFDTWSALLSVGYSLLATVKFFPTFYQDLLFLDDSMYVGYWWETYCLNWTSVGAGYATYLTVERCDHHWFSTVKIECVDSWAAAEDTYSLLRRYRCSYFLAFYSVQVLTQCLLNCRSSIFCR